MEKKGVLVLILLIVMPMALAQQINYNQYSELELKFELYSNFYTQQTSDKHDIDYITADLYFYPREFPTQQILSLNTISTPQIEAKKEDDKIQFKWEDPSEVEYSYGVSSRIKTINSIVKINDKLSYPAEIAGYDSYLKSNEKIDITPEIKAQANQIAQGEDDYYKVVFKIAEWVESNIKYDMSTLTSNIVQKSSWVLQNKEGVCDELSSLFISMVRSLGIPAKFVSGMAYSNTNNMWGPHAWAEVYFPTKGWIPFDVTYGQFGWIDPSHLKLMESIDSNEASVKYNWKSYNVDFVNDKISLTTNLVNKSEPIIPLVELRAKPLKDDVGAGSYVPIEVSIKNLQDFYLAESVFVLKAPDLTEKNVKRILLRPNEEKTLYWIAKIPEKLDSNFDYKTLLEFQDIFHSKATGEINYNKENPVISKNTAETMLKSLYIEEEKTYSRDLVLDCSVPRNYLYIYEETAATCIIKNKGTTSLIGINICLSTECQKANLDLGETKQILFPVHGIPSSTTKLKFSAENQDVEVNNYVDLNILDSPELAVINFEPPTEIDYKETKNIEFGLSTKAPVKNLIINMNGKTIYEYEQFSGSQNIAISAQGKEFAFDGEIDFSFEFYDENGKFYVERETRPVKISNSPFYINIIKYIKNLF